MSPPPQRIVSLLSSATEILFALGLGKRVVGIGHECDWPPEATTRPRVTQSFVDSSLASDDIDRQVRARLAAGEPLYAVAAQRLALLAPDLIVTQAQCDVCAVRYDDVMALVAQTPALLQTRVVALQPKSLDEILDDMVRVGDAAGVSEKARQVRAALRARIEFVRAAAMRAKRPRVVCIEWTEPLMLAANWTPTLIDIAGGEAGLVVADHHSTYADWEQVVAYDPEVLIISPCGFDLERSRVEAKRLRSLPGWGKLAAVRGERTFIVDGNAYLNRSGPRIVDSLEILAHLIQPALFPSPAQRGWCLQETTSPSGAG